MKTMRRTCSILFLCLATAAFNFGCSVSAKKLNAAEQRIAALAAKGVPDSLLSDAKVLLEQSRTSKQLGNNMGAKSQYDSLENLLTLAEKTFSATTSEVKPQVESLRKAISEKKLNLTGLHLKEADSLLAILDASIKGNDWPGAKSQALSLDTTLTSLLKNEQQAKETKLKLIGSWTAAQNLKSEGVKAVRKESYVFDKDGKISISEELKGQTNESFKEDWKFESWGTYDLKGDTIVINVTREKCPRQVYESLKVVGGKKSWVKSEKPTYDSTIASGKKNRVVAFSELLATYKKK